MFIFLAFLAVQYAQSASVEKRDALSDIFSAINQAVSQISSLVSNIPFIGSTISQALNQFQSGITGLFQSVLPTLAGGVGQAGSIVQDLTNQATAVSTSAAGPLQALLKPVTDTIKEVVDNGLQYGWNTTQCVFGQQDQAKATVQKAGTNIFGCTQTALKSTTELFADITSLNNQGVDLAKGIPGQLFGCFTAGLTNFLGCLTNLLSTTVSKGLLLVSSQTGDLSKLGDLAINLPGTLISCGADQLALATADVGGIITSVGQCMKQNAKTS